MTMVGIRDLKAHLSAYLRRVKKGESLAITEHGKSIAMLAPSAGRPGTLKAWRLVSEGKLDWGGGKPTGLKNRISARGKPLSQTILEDRKDRV
jgi:prevent-host-death family protein